MCARQVRRIQPGARRGHGGRRPVLDPERLRRRDPRAQDRPVRALDLDPHQPGRLLEQEHPVPIPSPAREHPPRAHVRVPGEGQLLARREDAHARRVRGLGRRQDEGGLAQVELARERLHLGARQAGGVGEHGERVAAEAPVREHVEGGEVKAAGHNGQG